ncbi:unnamed protein product, partial [Sphagnum compactum]
MNRKIVIVCLLGLTCICTASQVDSEIQNKNVDRTIDISSQLVKINYKITLEHKQGKPISNYIFVLPENERNHLAFISVKDTTKKELKTTEGKSPNGATFSFSFTASPNPVVYIESVYSKYLEPYPAQILQSDKQLVRYYGNAYFYSPYKTVTQKTSIHLASRNVENYTIVKPSSQSDTTITYGAYDNIA